MFSVVVWLCLCICECHLLPGKPHPLEALLAVLGTAGASELEEVVSLQVAGLLPSQLTYTARGERKRPKKAEKKKMERNTQREREKGGREERGNTNCSETEMCFSKLRSSLYSREEKNKTKQKDHRLSHSHLRLHLIAVDIYKYDSSGYL